jgi:hypothetical protein
MKAMESPTAGERNNIAIANTDAGHIIPLSFGYFAESEVWLFPVDCIVPIINGATQPQILQSSRESV